MQYPSKRVYLQGRTPFWLGNYGAEWGAGSYLNPEWKDIISANFESMAKYGYDSVMFYGPEVVFAGYTSPPATAMYEIITPVLDLCEEYGLTAEICCPMLHDETEWSWHTGWTTSDYETAYGDFFDLLEADSRIYGYFSEHPAYNGYVWLAGKTSKNIRLDYYGVGSEGANFQDLVGLADELAFETFQLVIPPHCVDAVSTLYDWKPTLKIGGWHQTLNLWAEDTGAPYWFDADDTPPVDYATQQSRATYWYGLINAEMVTYYGHKLDFVITQWCDCNETFEAMLAYNDSLDLTYAASPARTKKAQLTHKRGHKPAYQQAHATDSFENTGKEVILVKTLTGSASHTINVSGGAQSEDYTLTLNANNGRMLGPFPTSVFSTPVTITPDNTNMKVAIVRNDVPPTAPTAAYETDCVVKYSDWPSSGATVTNNGTGGATYNGTAEDADNYWVYQSGATCFYYSEEGDYVTIPAGISTSAAFTVEALIDFDFIVGWYSIFATTQTSTDSPFAIGVNAAGAVQVYKYCQDFSVYKQYTTTTDFTYPGMNFMQLSWDTTAYANEPIIKINNITQDLTDEGAGTPTSWMASTTHKLGYGFGGNPSQLYGKYLLFRFHDAALTTTQLSQNFAADEWRGIE